MENENTGRKKWQAEWKMRKQAVRNGRQNENEKQAERNCRQNGKREHMKKGIADRM